MWFRDNRLEQFWWFVCERQIIWSKRVIQGLPYPWTTHPILQQERFTNVYRELDPGTQYVCKFHKFVKISEGTERGRRKFIAPAPYSHTAPHSAPSPRLPLE